MECFVFAPYNVPFTAMAVRFTPAIDLTSPMRVRFKEVAHLLAQ
jgi:hypothetical protein